MQSTLVTLLCVIVGATARDTLLLYRDPDEFDFLYAIPSVRPKNGRVDTLFNHHMQLDWYFDSDVASQFSENKTYTRMVQPLSETMEGNPLVFCHNWTEPGVWESSDAPASDTMTLWITTEDRRHHAVLVDSYITVPTDQVLHIPSSTALTNGRVRVLIEIYRDLCLTTGPHCYRLDREQWPVLMFDVHGLDTADLPQGRASVRISMTHGIRARALHHGITLTYVPQLTVRRSPRVLRAYDWCTTYHELTPGLAKMLGEINSET